MKIYSFLLIGLMASLNVAADSGDGSQSFYLMEQGYTCTPMMITLPGAKRPKPIPSWKGRITVNGGKQHAVVLGDRCNDYGYGLEFTTINFSADGNSLVYQGQTYVYKKHPPYQ